MEALHEVGDGAELGVIALLLAGEQGAQAVVEVVGPRGVVAQAALARRPGDHGVVAARLGDDERRRVRRVDPRGELAQDRPRGGVVDRVDGVQAQAVDVEVADPALRALQDPLPHGVAPGVVVVHRRAPERRVLGGEVGAEGLERLAAARADVVVDDVEDDGEPRGVRGVHHPGEAVRTPVARLGGGEVDAVVAPAVAARELRDRHDLDRGDAELRQAREVLDRGVEGALGRERADVQLVEDEVLRRHAAPARVRPGEGPRVDHR